MTPDTFTFAPRDRVNHGSYGDGEVRSRVRGYVVVAFDALPETVMVRPGELRVIEREERA
jgi:hypothetical protein